MIQNNLLATSQNSQQNIKILDCSQSLAKLTYSQMAEGIDKQQQSERKDSLQVNQRPTNLCIGVQGPKTERLQTTIIDDTFQKSQNYSPRRCFNDNGIFLPFEFRKQSDKEMQSKAPYDNFLAVKKFPDIRGRPLIKNDLKIDILRPQKVELGREIISSVVKSDHNNQPESIDQGSLIINNIRSTAQRSHFKNAVFDAGSGNIFQRFQQQKKDALESDHSEFKITVTPEPIKRSSQYTFDQASANGVTFAAGGNTKQSMKSSSKQERSKRSIQDLRALSGAKNPQEKEHSSSGRLKEPKIKRLENNMIQSKIITHAQQNVHAQRGEDGLRYSRKDGDMKKPIIQVADRMKSTIDPKPPSSEYKVVPVATNLSQPDKHSVHNMPQQNLKIIQLLSPQDFLPRKENETKIKNDIQGYLVDKMDNIQRMIENLKCCSFFSAQIEKYDNNQGDTHLEQKWQKKMNQKKKSLNHLISDEVLNDLSFIDSDKKSKPRAKYHDKRNEQFNKKFEFLAERILKMQQILLKKTQREFNYGTIDQDIQSSEMKSPRFIHKNSSSQTKILKKVKSQTKIHQQRQEFVNISDQDFTRLENYMSKIDFVLQKNSSSYELAGLGIKILNAFKIKTQKGESSMDMTEYENNCVQYYYLKGNVYIKLQYSGSFYIGDGEKFSQLSPFVKSGEGIEIMPSKYVYQGQFHEDKRHGEGMISYISGDKYKGQWRNDLYEGYGALYSKTSKYRGNFCDGKKHGIGEQKFRNGDTYEGSYYLNNYNGKGQYTWSNGTIYQGEFKNDQMSGQGIWRSHCGDTYQGQYYKGKRHGQGRYIKRNGEILQGQFIKGNFVQRKCKGVLAPEKQLTFDSFDEERPQIISNDCFSSKYNLPKQKIVILEKQPSSQSRLKAKKISAKW